MPAPVLDTGQTDAPRTWGFADVLDLMFVFDDSLPGLVRVTLDQLRANVLASTLHAQEALRNHDIVVARRASWRGGRYWTCHAPGMTCSYSDVGRLG